METSVKAGRAGVATRARSGSDVAAHESTPAPRPPFAPDERKACSFTFIDLFAGIGGTRLAFQNAGGRCVFSSEWDEHAHLTYLTNFGERPAGDITKIHSSDVPGHDVLVAGFPCQPFSIAGVSKRKALNRPHGFRDKTQGTLFFEIARIIQGRRPRAFVLENVKNLRSHDGGRTFRVICQTLSEELGYYISSAVIDARRVVPQHRERIYIVGFDTPRDFRFPEFEDSKPKMADILQSDVPQKYTLTPHLWEYLQKYAEKHRKKGNGFGYGLVDLQGVARTISARYYKDGAEVLIPQGDNGIPRRLTPRECARLMGFPETFEIPVSDTQAYRQFGNSVVVPVVQAIAEKIADCLVPEKRLPAAEAVLLRQK